MSTVESLEKNKIVKKKIKTCNPLPEDIYQSHHMVILWSFLCVHICVYTHINIKYMKNIYDYV